MSVSSPVRHSSEPPPLAPERPGAVGIDVIIPCYKYAHLLTECVESVLQQGLNNLRILIIDDASPDDTPIVAGALARRDDRITVLRHGTNLGHIATYNEGLNWASARYTLLLSADDLLLPGALSRATELLDAHPDVGLVYGRALELQTGEALPRILPSADFQTATIMSGKEFFRANRFSNPVATCTAVVRTATQKQVGSYRPELPHAGDMEMWLRFAAHGPVGRLDAYQGIYRRHTSNMSISYIKDQLLDLRQRKAVLDFVFEAHSVRLDGLEELRRVMYSGLALEAAASASAPFLQGDIAQFEAALAFASDLDPAVRRSLTWRLQTIKRLLGPRLWAALGPMRSLARSRMRRGVA